MKKKSVLGALRAMLLGGGMLLAAHSVQATDNTGSGGTITYTDTSGLNPVASPPYNNGYVVHTFTSGGTLNVPAAVSASYLIVGGGGGGGRGFGAGGGAGGMLTGSASVMASTGYPVVVGAGGAGAASNQGTDGNNSSFNGISATGGGGGGGSSQGGRNGGSGGGATGGTTPGTGVAGQGNNGGSGGAEYGGGGGGAGGVGANAAGTSGGVGGAALASSISGTSTYYAQGGCAYNAVNSPSNGGGNTGTSGTNNRGGGGGAFDGNTVGAGGSGIVIVRYLYADFGNSLIVSTLSPANNATGVLTGSNLVVTFSQAIAIGTGNITIKNLTDTTNSTIAVTDGSQVSVSGSDLTINPTADLVAGKDYAIQIDATAIKDLANNPFAGIADDTTWNFTTEPPPLASTLSPADNATNVATGSNLVITFNKAITIGTGNITLKNLTDGPSYDVTIAITDGSQVSVAGAVLTINPTADLIAGKDYAIRIDATAIKDSSGNFFAGIADDTTWNFATDGTPPTVVTLSPADNATNVVTGGNLVVTFSEAITIGTGNITVKNLTDGPSYDVTIDITSGSPQVSVVGSVLTINPTADLTAGKDYAIRIDATAIKDGSGNLFAGIADDTTWNFTTDGTPPTVVTLSPADDATDGSPFGNLVVTFDEAIAIGTGNITIKSLTDATESTIDITDGGQVSVAGSVLTINPTADLTPGKSYAIRIDATAITDISGNFFAGISDDITWNFTTWVIVLFDDFATNPNITTQWTRYNYYQTVPTVPGPVTWNSTNQNLDLSKTTSGNPGWVVGLYRTGATRSATDPVTMTVNVTSVASAGSAGSFAQVGLMITAAPQQGYITGTGDSYTFYLRAEGATMSTSSFKYYVFRTVADGETYKMYSGTSSATAGQHTLDIKRNGANYEFWADNTLLYTSGENPLDFYDAASKNSMIYFQAMFGGDSAMTATVDDFGIPPVAPPSGYASWRSANGATGQALNQDHDGDGVPNGIEYFLGGPTGNTTGFTALPGVVKDPGTGALSVTWAKGSGYAGTYGTGFVVETSETLTDPWTPETLAPGGQVTDTASTVTYTFPTPLGSKKFARLMVTGP